MTFTFDPQIIRNAQHYPNSFFPLTKSATWNISMELWIQNWGFDHIWLCGDHTLQPLDLKFSEMLNTAPIKLYNWQKFLPVTSKWSYGSKTEFVVTLTFDLWTSKYSEMLNTALISLFPGLKLQPDAFEWIYGPKTEFLPTFGPVATLTFDQWKPKSNKFIVIA